MRAALGVMLIAIGVTRHTALLEVAGALVLGSVALRGARSRRGS